MSYLIDVMTAEPADSPQWHWFILSHVNQLIKESQVGWPVSSAHIVKFRGNTTIHQMENHYMGWKLHVCVWSSKNLHEFLYHVRNLKFDTMSMIYSLCIFKWSVYFFNRKIQLLYIRVHCISAESENLKGHPVRNLVCRASLNFSPSSS